MQTAEPIPFTRLADGTLLLRQADGTYHPVPSQSDQARLGQMTEEQIEIWSRTDVDHPGLDDAFWLKLDAPPPPKKAISIKLDADVLDWFKKRGKGYQTRINRILRRYVEANGNV
jgi:uncharacterized protein (DUF4415 family)